MKENSLNLHSILLFFGLSLCVYLPGCYTFTGSSVPPHLRTLVIGTVSDESGFGNPEYAEYLTNRLIDEFRDDGTFRLVQGAADAKLEVAIQRIQEEILTVQTGEMEAERKITVRVDASYWDNVLGKQIWEKSFSQYRTYSPYGAPESRDAAVFDALDAIAEDILIAVISNW